MSVSVNASVSVASKQVMREPTCKVAGSIGAHKSSSRHGVQVVVLGRVCGASEHVEHAGGDGKASPNVDCRSQHSCGRQALHSKIQLLCMM